MTLHRTLLLILSIQTITSSVAAPFIYVTNILDNTVSVIDAATNMVVTTIPGFHTPLFQALTPNNCFDYVANILNNTISVVSTATNTIVTTISSPQFDLPFDIAFISSGKTAYVANNTVAGNGTVSRIDVATNTVVGSAIPVGLKPAVLEITPNNKFVYVDNSGDSTISVIQIATNTVIDTISSVQFSGLADMAITPNGKTLYVVDAFNNHVSRIDTATNTVVGSAIAVGNFPQGLAMSPDGKTLYVMNTGDDTVSRIDVATNTVIGSPITVGSAPQDMAIIPDGSMGYVVNNGSNTVSVIDLATNVVIATIPVGRSPFSAVSTEATVDGVIRCNTFLNKKEFILQIMWNNFSPHAVSYRIFNRNGDVIGTVSASDTLRFFVCFRSMAEIEGITVASVSPTGTESVHFPVSI